jgi:hypothetical protein
MTVESEEVQDNDENTGPIVPKAEQAARTPFSAGPSFTAFEQTWHLARLGLARSLHPVRNRINDDRTVYGDLGVRDIKHAGWILLDANYQLTTQQIIAIMEAAPRQELIDAVIAVLFVDECDQVEQNYSNWARSSLIASGLDPLAIAAEDLPHVLRQLVETKRAMRLDQFTASGQFAAARTEMMQGA